MLTVHSDRVSRRSLLLSARAPAKRRWVRPQAWSAMWVLLVGVLAALPTQAAEIYYSFSADGEGGVALLRIDDETGTLSQRRRLWSAPDLSRPRKLAVSDDGRTLLLTDETSRSGNLILLRLDREPLEAVRLDFPSVPDEVRAVRGGFVVGGDSGNLVFVDAERGTVATRWSSRAALRPSGHKPEDIAVLPGGDRILLSFQKDSSGGRHLGSRVVTLTVPGLELVSDLQLPRDRPELHIAGNTKEQGPNPEVIVVSPRTNTVLLTLDLYGGLLMADLDAMLSGRLERVRTVSADPEGAWGVAFPDRLIHLRSPAGDRVVVANAGEAGGVVVVDLGRRERIAAAKTIPGLDTLVHLPTVDVVVAAPAGKIKSRVGTEVQKQSEPSRDLHLIDLSRLESGELPVVLHPMGDLTTSTVAVVPARQAWVVAVMGRGSDQRFALLEIARDPEGGFVVHERWTEAARGEVRRIVVRPNER